MQKYTQALTCKPGWSVALTNRALCHKRREDWDAVHQDASQSLLGNREAVKVCL